MVGTNDLTRAADFYDALLGALGARRFNESARGISWTFGPGTTSLSAVKPFDGQPATVGNGVMVALGVASRAEVETAHRLALELGATDEGKPGPRGASGFYAGYFRDPDGNKLNVFCIERTQPPSTVSRSASRSRTSRKPAL
jgi:catechol 2,3-dioxygenase-like lactoylglutathione lyase family enzyme